jgi:hypothetical protein
MSPTPLRVLIIVAFATGSAAAQPGGPQPVAVLGEPAPRLPLIDLNDPLGPPDQPFRPFAPLGPPPALADEGIGSRFGLGVLAGRFGVPGYSATYIPAQPVSGQPTDLSVLRQDLSIFAPIYREGCDTAAVGFGIHNSTYWTKAIIPGFQRPFPDSMWDIQAGVAYSHAWDNGWTTGAVVSAGAANDAPFEQNTGLVASLTLYNAFPAEGRDAWVLGVNYSPTSDSPYPLPIAFYYWKPRDELEMGIGLPFFMKYQFLPQWTAEAYWIPIRSVSAKVTWQSEERPGFRAYGNFNWANEVFFLSDRVDNTERFYSYEKRLGGGMTFDLPYRLRLDVSAGYVFDRFFFVGKQYSDRNQGRVNVGPGMYGQIQLRLQF